MDLNNPGSYAILFFMASHFTFTTRHIHNWVSFLLWPSLFISSGTVYPPFPIGYWISTDLGGLIFWSFLWWGWKSKKAGLKLNIQKTKIMASGPITSQQIDEEKLKTGQILFSWVPKSLWTVTAATKLKDACSLEGKLWQTWTAYSKAETSLL